MSKMIDGRWQRANPRTFRSWGDWMFKTSDSGDAGFYDEWGPVRFVSFPFADSTAIWTNREGGC